MRELDLLSQGAAECESLLCYRRELLKLFTTKEIMRWKELLQIYEPELRAAFPGNQIFSTSTDDGKQRWEDLKKRVVEHVSRSLVLVSA